MRAILCVIDLSPSTLHVLQFASTIAQARKEQLSIVFPYRLIDQSFRGDAGKLRLNLEQQARAKFSAFQKKLPALDMISFEFKPAIGFAGYIVESYVQQQPLDLIVIGQEQAQTINDGDGLSLAQLIRNLKIPFTIVPEESNLEIQVA